MPDRSPLRGRRVLLLAVGTRGDVEPAARLAHTLAGSGAKVCVTVLADGADRVRRAGATPLVVGPPAAEAMWPSSPVARGISQLNPGLHYLQQRARMAAGAGRLVGTVRPWLDGADVILSGLATARLVPVLRRAGLRAPARLVLHAPLVPSPEGVSAWGRPPFDLLPPQIEDRRQRAMWRMTTGLSSASARALADLTDVAEADWHDLLDDPLQPPLLTTSPVLDPDPSPALLQTGPWADPTPTRGLPPDLDRWLAAHPGAILLALGSLPLTSPARQVARLLGAASDSGRPAVVQVSGHPPGPMAGGFVAAEVDHRALLPRVDAVLHHGGSGTTHAVTAHGIPQVVVPHLGDQGHYARRVHALGLGPAPVPAALAGRALLARRIAQAVSDPGHRGRAALVAGSMRGEDGLTRAVEEIREMLA